MLTMEQSEKEISLLCFQEMHLEDTTRFCPKEERESEQTSFSDQNPRQDQKGGFRSSFRKLFKKKWVALRQESIVTHFPLGWVLRF